MATTRRHGPNALARRDALLRATVEVAAERGTAGVTHRAVTERAGLPLATVSYFFPSIEELAEEALRTFTEAEAAVQIGLAEQLADAQNTPDEVAQAFAAAAAPRLPETMAMFEAYLHAARKPEFREPVAAALDALRTIAAAAVRAAGAPDPEAAAPAFTALAHGFALHQLAAPDSVEPGAVHAASRALFLGYLLDNGYTDLALDLADSNDRRGEKARDRRQDTAPRVGRNP
ncbi:TetR/AcrR family transcriptional regulator [Nocardia sp. NPDC057272]|uniref:TetR/AcrR family transcriptional regulator n=1 Tax=Nocardia sp. NPDC057272 TaxID=3346079 RepID=UPI0036294DEC